MIATSSSVGAALTVHDFLKTGLVRKYTSKQEKHNFWRFNEWSYSLTHLGWYDGVDLGRAHLLL